MNAFGRNQRKTIISLFFRAFPMLQMLRLKGVSKSKRVRSDKIKHFSVCTVNCHRDDRVEKDYYRKHTFWGYFYVMNSHDGPGRINLEMRDWHPTFSKFVPLFPAFLHVGFSDPHSLLNPYSICCYIYYMTG